jgi:hypothetical protein
MLSTLLTYVYVCIYKCLSTSLALTAAPGAFGRAQQAVRKKRPLRVVLADRTAIVPLFACKATDVGGGPPVQLFPGTGLSVNTQGLAVLQSTFDRECTRLLAGETAGAQAVVGAAKAIAATLLTVESPGLHADLARLGREIDARSNGARIERAVNNIRSAVARVVHSYERALRVPGAAPQSACCCGLVKGTCAPYLLLGDVAKSKASVAVWVARVCSVCAL